MMLPMAGMLGPLGGSRFVPPSGGGVSTLIAHAMATAVGLSPVTATTSAIDTTGANLFVLGVVKSSGASATPVDSEGNTYTPLTVSPSGDPNTLLFYCRNPITSTAQTFAMASGYPAFFVAAFTAPSFSLAQEDGEFGVGNAPLQPGRVSTAGAGLFVTVFGDYANGTATVDSGFSITDQVTTSGSYTGGFAWKANASGGSENPTWARPAGTYNTVTSIVAFNT